MSVNPYQVRQMLRTYGKQLVNARRLARFQRHMRIAQGAPERTDVARDAKRRELVEKVAREIIDNLLVIGTENPIVDEIKSELEMEFGSRLHFEYPFMEEELHIFKEVDGNPEKMGAEERRDLIGRLWQITLSKVDQTML